MTNKNYQIAKFYSKLFESLEVLATDIEEHLENYELTINKQGDSK